MVRMRQPKEDPEAVDDFTASLLTKQWQDGKGTSLRQEQNFNSSDSRQQDSSFSHGGKMRDDNTAAKLWQGSLAASLLQFTAAATTYGGFLSCLQLQWLQWAKRLVSQQQPGHFGKVLAVDFSWM